MAMPEPPPPRNRDQELPARQGDTPGEHEPLMPKPEPLQTEQNSGVEDSGMADQPPPSKQQPPEPEPQRREQEKVRGGPSLNPPQTPGPKRQPERLPLPD